MYASLGGFTVYFILFPITPCKGLRVDTCCYHSHQFGVSSLYFSSVFPLLLTSISSPLGFNRKGPVQHNKIRKETKNSAGLHNLCHTCDCKNTFKMVHWGKDRHSHIAHTHTKGKKKGLLCKTAL